MVIREENNQTQNYARIVKDYLSREEINALQVKSNFKASLEIIVTWFWIVSAFALVAVWPTVWSVLIALVVIGAKQLGCAIIMHDTAHYSLFTSKKVNDVIGNCFGAYPIIHNIKQYRPYHLQHHMATGTEDDPDVNLTKGYPTTKYSLIRKFSRDLFGPSGLKNYYGLLAMHLGFLKYNLGNYIEKIIVKERGYLWKNSWSNLRGPLLANLIMFGICWSIGMPLLYLLWPTAMLTTYMLILRVRSMAEHSVVSDRRDPLQNTRTIKANLIERMLFAPLNVNYHMEHHLIFTIPSYNFRAMHKILWKKGFYNTANYSPGYWNIIKIAATK